MSVGAGLRLLRDLVARPRRIAYGSHEDQRADLHLPDGAGPHPVAVLVHGGSWQARYGKVLMKGLAGDLARRGWAAYNVEYRRVGGGEDGGWPATFDDVADAVAHLSSVDAPLDLARTAFVGHSAGGQLAVWAAGEAPAGVRPVIAVAQAGVVDLAGAWARGGPVDAVMGGSPDQVPDRYALVDPVRRVPPPCPVLLVHGTQDTTVSVARSRTYAAAARAAGGEVELVEVPGAAGAHRAHIDPRGRAWGEVVSRLPPARG